LDAVSTCVPSGEKYVLVGCDDGNARYLNASTGGAHTVLRGHSGAIFDVAISADGNTLLTASHDHTVNVWRAGDGSLVTVLRGHAGSIRSVSFSPDSERVLTASADRTAKIWDARTGDVLNLLRGHEDDVWCAKARRWPTAGRFD